MFFVRANRYHCYDHERRRDEQVAPSHQVTGCSTQQPIWLALLTWRARLGVTQVGTLNTETPVLADSVSNLPRQSSHVGTPPIKCQGIKTKLVPFIFRSIEWSCAEGARWIEPFVGSGVVALNLAPQRAVLADANPHIIDFFRAIQRGHVNASTVREFLNQEGVKLSVHGADHYYEVRARFNESGSPFDFLFLNRSCFNGVMRFNKRGRFNVPFGHKPHRFSRSYITKVANQVNWAAKQMSGKEIEWRVADWTETLAEARSNDFVYMDPPYIGRHADYYNSWDETAASSLASTARRLPCGFAVSMWLQNAYRKNSHIEQCWSDMEIKGVDHFYHVGARENLRNEMREALIIRPGSVAQNPPNPGKESSEGLQQTLFESPTPYLSRGPTPPSMDCP